MLAAERSVPCREAPKRWPEGAKRCQKVPKGARRSPPEPLNSLPHGLDHGRQLMGSRVCCWLEFFWVNRAPRLPLPLPLHQLLCTSTRSTCYQASYWTDALRSPNLCLYLPPSLVPVTRAHRLVSPYRPVTGAAAQCNSSTVLSHPIPSPLSRDGRAILALAGRLIPSYPSSVPGQ